MHLYLLFGGFLPERSEKALEFLLVEGPVPRLVEHAKSQPHLLHRLLAELLQKARRQGVGEHPALRNGLVCIHVLEESGEFFEVECSRSVSIIQKLGEMKKKTVVLSEGMGPPGG